MLDQLDQAGRLNQRGVASDDEREAIVVGQLIAAHLNGMPGSQLLGLLGKGQRIIVAGLKLFSHQVRFVAHHRDFLLDASFVGSVQNKVNHGPIDDGAQNLGKFAVHASSLAGGEDDSEFVDIGDPKLPLRRWG